MFETELEGLLSDMLWSYKDQEQHPPISDRIMAHLVDGL